jgi:hypothetical protein
MIRHSDLPGMLIVSPDSVPLLFANLADNDEKFAYKKVYIRPSCGRGWICFGAPLASMKSLIGCPIQLLRSLSKSALSFGARQEIVMDRRRLGIMIEVFTLPPG